MIVRVGANDLSPLSCLANVDRVHPVLAIQLAASWGAAPRCVVQRKDRQSLVDHPTD